jgi:hypothetical protein
MDARAKALRPRASRFRRFGRLALRVALALVLLVVALPPALLLALRFCSPRSSAVACTSPPSSASIWAAPG